jgi:hypothetical protein
MAKGGPFSDEMLPTHTFLPAPPPPRWLCARRLPRQSKCATTCAGGLRVARGQERPQRCFVGQHWVDLCRKPAARNLPLSAARTPGRQADVVDRRPGWKADVGQPGSSPVLCGVVEETNDLRRLIADDEKPDGDLDAFARAQQAHKAKQRKTRLGDRIFDSQRREIDRALRPRVEEGKRTLGFRVARR